MGKNLISDLLLPAPSHREVLGKEVGILTFLMQRGWAQTCGKFALPVSTFLARFVRKGQFQSKRLFARRGQSVKVYRKVGIRVS